ncbi:replication initiator protein [Spirosoma oryzae]|uniref:Replication initiator protein n=1 Tax=Spirosoma oryzae TaxID=1469603 RepID=A0A2T0RQW8_9BACT|nr:replication initiation protein [Spirosoma oryzae]PRY23500.1 replication initiator protein [Spirosoma oryzae]
MKGVTRSGKSLIVKPVTQAEQLEISFVSSFFKTAENESIPAEPRPSLNLTRIREPLRLLTNRTNELSFFERRIYWLVLRELKSIQEIKTEKITPYSQIYFEFHYSEVVSGHVSVTQHLRKILQAFMKRIITLEDPVSGRITDAIAFPVVDYWPGKGVIQIKMAPEVIPMFLDMSKGYTSFQLEQALALTSEYAQILFPNLTRYIHTGFWQISLEEFRKLMCVKDGKYTNFNDIRRRVIDVPLAQINSETNLNVTYDVLKQSRTVVGIRFNIEQKNKPGELTADQQAELKRNLNQQFDLIMQLDTADLIAKAGDLLKRHYPSYTPEQRKQILMEEQKLKAFIWADLHVEHGFAKTDAQAYVAESVFNYKKGRKNSTNSNR